MYSEPVIDTDERVIGGRMAGLSAAIKPGKRVEKKTDTR
jgi:hypothetical protein